MKPTNNKTRKKVKQYGFKGVSGVGVTNEMTNKELIITGSLVLLILIPIILLMGYESNRQHQEKYSIYKNVCESRGFEFIAYDTPTRWHYMDCVEIVDGIEINSYYLTREGRLALRK